MQKNKLFNPREIRGLFLGAIILGFIFSFREWGYGEVNLNIGLINLIRATILSLVVLLVYQVSHKVIAKKYDAISTFRLWSIKRFWFTKSSKIENIKLFGKSFKTIKMGFIFPVLLSLLSNGFIRFAAVGSSEITEISRKRIGREFTHLTEFELAKIHLVGPLTTLLLALVLFQFPGFEKIVEISYMVALFSMIPFSGLDGAKIFFGSRALYLFGIVFMGLAVILMHILSPIWTLVISILTAIILLIIFLYKNS